MAAAIPRTKRILKILEPMIMAYDDTRLTFISQSGDVLYDSDSSKKLENHKSRAEVKQALAEGQGEDIRMSDTVGKELNFSMEVDPDTGTAYHGDAEYLSWQQSIDSQKEEISNERHEIFSGASCPDLSFDNLIGIGDLSGVSREFMTIDAKIKATEQMEIFGPVVQRCVAIVQAGMANISHIKNSNAIMNNYFEVSFGSILPKNLAEDLQNLSTAGGGKPINSQETLTARSPYTQNVKEEIEKMKQEEQAASVNNNPLGQIYQ